MLGCRHWLPSHSGALKFSKWLAWIWNVCDFQCSAGAWFVNLDSETFISLIVTPMILTLALAALSHSRTKAEVRPTTGHSKRFL